MHPAHHTPHVHPAAGQPHKDAGTIATNAGTPGSLNAIALRATSLR